MGAAAGGPGSEGAEDSTCLWQAGSKGSKGLEGKGS